jgi:hypothetical protein
MAVVQRQTASADSGAVNLPKPALPLAMAAPTPTPAPSNRVQRGWLDNPANDDDDDDHDDNDGDKRKDNPPSAAALNKLARQIYPLLKRMLAIERERR